MHGPRRISRQTRVLLVLIVLAAVIAVSTSSGGLTGSNRQGVARPADLVWRVALGGTIGALIGMVVLAVFHRLAPSKPTLARWLYGEVMNSPEVGAHASWVTAPRSFRRALRRSIPLILLLVAVGALIGASRAPLHPQTRLRPPTSEAGSASDGKPSEEVKGRYVDTDGDGKPELQIDGDGDGKYEQIYVPCPGKKLPTNVPGPGDSIPDDQPRGTVRIPIDEGCDGTIDRYVDVRLDQLRTIPTAPPTTGARNAPVPPSQKNKVSIPPIVGQILLALIAAAVIAAVVVGILRRKRKPAKDDDPEDVEVAPDPATIAVAASVERSRTELAVDDDPRRAIIVAYETLLSGLGAVGLARRPQEAPEEYLRRSLAGVHVDHRPFHELTGLFSLARFSSHPITESHRSAAQEALASAAASLPNVAQEVR